MKITAEPIKSKNLTAGDLFSTGNQLYWDNHRNNRSIGERVYIRTEEPCPAGQEEEDIFLITIER